MKGQRKQFALDGWYAPCYNKGNTARIAFSPHKPHLPVALFHALIAASVSLPMAAHAELLPIPVGYTEVTIDSAGEYEDFTPEEGTDYAFTVADGVTLTAGTGETLLPAGNVYVQGSGADNISDLFQGNSMTLYAEDDLLIKEFYIKDGVGKAAISTDSFSLSKNTGKVTFSSCSSGGDGAVLKLQENGQARISDNQGMVSFEGNKASSTSKTYKGGRGGLPFT